MADDEPPPPPPTLESMFEAFAKFGEPLEFDGSTILLSQCDAWMAQAKLLSKKLTLSDTGITYNRFKKRRITYDMFVVYLQRLCDEKGLDLEETKLLMIECGLPGAVK